MQSDALLLFIFSQL